MINIGICDDSRADRQCIREICDEITDDRIEEVVIREYQNAAEFIRSEQSVDLLVLDIEMQGMSGIDLKNYLQTAGSDTVIIFVTDHSEMVLSAFGIHVFGFVEKAKLALQFPKILNAALNILGQNILLCGKWDSRKILFIRAERVYCYIYMENGKEAMVRKPMRELEKELEPAGFIRTHRSYLVNAAKIENMDEKNIYLPDHAIPVAAREQRKVRDQYHSYCEKNARFC